ncbi:MAG: helix-turn-helix domain-containing protein [Rhodospirillales bacterium]|nr:helix-turn-helix domain-containing protein [Rhodospirillales bacterium]
MARAALNWPVQRLAGEANVGEATIRRLEQGRAVPIPATASAIRTALGAAGVEFIAENGGGPGVRLGRRHEK